MTYMGIALSVKVMYHQQFLHPHERPNVCMHVQELILKDKSLTYVYIGKHGLKKAYNLFTLRVIIYHLYNHEIFLHSHDVTHTRYVCLFLLQRSLELVQYYFLSLPWYDLSSHEFIVIHDLFGTNTTNLHMRWSIQQINWFSIFNPPISNFYTHSINTIYDY